MKIWDKIAHLARLNMTKEEEKLLIPQVKKVVTFFHHISEIPTDSIEPLVQPLDEKIPFRKDEAQKRDPQLLDQVVEAQDEYIKVPLVVSSSQKKK